MKRQSSEVPDCSVAAHFRMMFVLFACVVVAPMPLGSAVSSSSHPFETIGDIMRTASIDVVADTTKQDSFSEIMRGLARVPPPASLTKEQFEDPISSFGAAACHRDYNATCPDNFVALPQTDRCVADSQYAGPCTSESYAFQAMSLRAKARWSDQCFAFWPCVHCDRDYRGSCPHGWIVISVSGGTCQAPSGYTGPCKGTASMLGWNLEMLKRWSSECGAFWPCKQYSNLDLVELLYPISKRAVESRIARGLQ